MNMWLEPSLAPTTHPIENWTDFLRPDSWTAFAAVVLHFCEVNTRRRTNKKTVSVPWRFRAANDVAQNP